MSAEVEGSCFGSSSGAGTEPTSEHMREFISSEITRGVLVKYHVVFGSVTEGFLDILDERLGTLYAEFMVIGGSLTLSFYEREVDLEHLVKRGSDQVQAREGPRKTPEASDQLLEGQQGRGQCIMCGKLHDGATHSKGIGCYKCSRDCPQEESLVCFLCD